MGGCSGAVFFPNETEDSTNDIGGGKFYEKHEIHFQMCDSCTYP